MYDKVEKFFLLFRPQQVDAAGIKYYFGGITRVRRGSEDDAGGPENLQFNFIWPNNFEYCRIRRIKG